MGPAGKGRAILTIAAGSGLACVLGATTLYGQLASAIAAAVGARWIMNGLGLRLRRHRQNPAFRPQFIGSSRNAVARFGSMSLLAIAQFAGKRLGRGQMRFETKRHVESQRFEFFVFSAGNSVFLTA